MMKSNSATRRHLLFTSIFAILFAMISCQSNKPQGQVDKPQAEKLKMLVTVLDKHDNALEDVRVDLSLHQKSLTDVDAFFDVDNDGNISINLDMLNRESVIIFSKEGYFPRAFNLEEGVFIIHLTRSDSINSLPSGAIVEDLEKQRVPNTNNTTINKPKSMKTD